MRFRGSSIQISGCRSWWRGAASVVIALLVATARARDAVPDRLSFLPEGAVRLHGHLGERIDASLAHGVMAQDVEALIRPFRERRDVTEWRSEFWGKWITSAIDAYRWNPNPGLAAKIQGAVDGLLATQSADGYIGAYAPENHLQRWDVWGRKYTLLGLLAWNEVRGDERALAGAIRLADHLLTEIGPGKPDPFRHDLWHGMATSSVLEPMVRLYRRTGDPRYLDFCTWLIGEWPTRKGPDLLNKAARHENVYAMFPASATYPEGEAPPGSSKAYEMMSCFEGLVELHRVTGDARFRAAAEWVYRSIAETEITVIGTGSDWERWNGGRERQTATWRKGMETCVTVTWIKFAGQLLRLTGDARYADAVEIASYNALLGAMNADGSWWAHFTQLSGRRHAAPEQGGMHQNCCVANGPRALMLLPRLAVLRSATGLAITTANPLTAKTTLPSGNRVTIEQRTDYPAAGLVRIELGLEKPENFSLDVRIPDWADGASVQVGGREVAGVAAGQYVRLQREWRNGDAVSLMLPLALRLVADPGRSGAIALRRGPLVLARDSRLAGSDGWQRIRPDVEKARLTTEAPASWGWLGFQLDWPDGTTMRLSDFSSVGNAWNSSSYATWLTRETP